MFELLLISPPMLMNREPLMLTRMFEAGLGTLHVRKPGATRAEVEAYLRAIPECHHGQLMLHQHHELANDYAVKGLHLSATTRATWRGKLLPGQCLSTSFHRLEEVSQHRRRYDYVLLSPIFNSISKADYAAAFEWPQLQTALAAWARRPAYQPRVVALGGIDAATISAAQKAGFAGAAVLGAVWQQPDPAASFRELLAVSCKL